MTAENAKYDPAELAQRIANSHSRKLTDQHEAVQKITDILDMHLSHAGYSNYYVAIDLTNRHGRVESWIDIGGSIQLRLEIMTKFIREAKNAIGAENLVRLINHTLSEESVDPKSPDHAGEDE